MAQTQSFPRWLHSYRTVLFTFFRALLGLLLFVKGKGAFKENWKMVLKKLKEVAESKKE